MNLLDDQPLQDVENKADDSWVRGVSLQHSPHEQCWDGGLLHELLQYDGQNFLSVDLKINEILLVKVRAAIQKYSLD